jgi:hypothetical protein
MTRSRLNSFDRFAVALLLSTVAVAGCKPPAEPNPGPVPAPVTDDSPRHFTAADIRPQLPYDVDVARVRRLDDAGKIETAQREFDILSWQAFLALNWPASASGEPQGSVPTTVPETLRVWSFYRPSSTIFLPNGAAPEPTWDKPGTRAFDVVLTKTKAAWRQHATVADQNFEAFSGPLVDQNGKWARYQALVNHEEFDYLVSNKLYSLEGQVEFSQKHEGNEVSMPINDGVNKHGAIEIKLAWKELGPNDDKSRFLTQQVKVKVSEASGQTPRTITAGLVGMHIIMRTVSSPEWIWATFEQIDNVRQNARGDGTMSHANFNNPATPSAKPNVLAPMNAVRDPATKQFTTWYESLTKTPVQVQRVEVPTQPNLNDLDATLANDAKQLNGEVQALVRGLDRNNALQYYELIDTQWPVHPNAPAFAGGDGSAPGSIAHKTPGDVLPVFLVNTTMETYFQKGTQPAGALEQDDRLPADSLAKGKSIDNTVVTGTESCVGCHYSAGIALGFKKDAQGNFQIVDGHKVPIYGENGHFGKTGNGNFSWMLQIEASSVSEPNQSPLKTKSGVQPNAQP